MRQIIFLNELNSAQETAVANMAVTGGQVTNTKAGQKLVKRRAAGKTAETIDNDYSDPTSYNRGSQATTAYIGDAVGAAIRAGDTAKAEELIKAGREHKLRLKSNPEYSNSSLTVNALQTAKKYGGGRFVK